MKQPLLKFLDTEEDIPPLLEEEFSNCIRCTKCLSYIHKINYQKHKCPSKR